MTHVAQRWVRAAETKPRIPPRRGMQGDRMCKQLVLVDIRTSRQHSRDVTQHQYRKVVCVCFARPNMPATVFAIPIQSGPPPQAPSAVSTKASALSAALSVPERAYVRSLKKRERTSLENSFSEKKKRAPDTSTPLRIRVLQSKLPDQVRWRLFDELHHGCNEKRLEWTRRALQLPLGVFCSPSLPSVEVAIQNAKQALSCVEGHDSAKREVLKLVCQASYGGGATAGSYPLALEGPPGTGKTHFVRNGIANALGRPFVSIQLGGATDVSYLLGSVFTYEGSKEGRLAGSLIEAACMDPIVHFDEVDKVSNTERGEEIFGVLIHLVDPTANSAIRDRYFHDIDLDFSRCTFVFSYNDASRVHPILLDRMKRVEMPAQNMEERKAIAMDHFVPRTQRRLHTPLSLSPGALQVILKRANAGNGMRGVEKDVEHVLGCAQLSIAEASGESVEVDGHVTEAYARACLSEARGGNKPPPPPAGMYT